MAADGTEPGPDTLIGDDDAEGAVKLLGHDIRAALSDVLGGLRLIEMDRVDAATRLQLERMRAAGELLARLLEEGLATMLGEAEAAHPVNVQLPRILRDVQMRWSGRAREKGLEFVLSQEGDLPAVITADRIGLERSLSNMLSNAIKYTDQGRVQLSVRRGGDGGLAFEVQDDGPGFSDAALARLFTLAGRPQGLAKPGEGLGLFIAREMATRTGGEVAVRNRPGGGATVTLTLPPGACHADTGAPGEAAHPLPDLSRSKVLLAEDSPTAQLVIGRMLQRMGAEVEVAADGTEAVQALERASFDLALIDIEMPRLNGLDVIRFLRAQGGPQARIPVLAVTAYVLRANREAIYAAGADAILAKPVSGIDAVATAIGRVMAPVPGMDPGDGPPAPGAGAPAMVQAQFDRLIEVAGPDGAPELLRRLLEDLRHVERRLVRALDVTDWAEIRSQTHVLIALAGAVGALRLQHHAEAMNAAANRRDSACLASRAAELLALLDDLIHHVARTQGAAGGG